MHHKAGCWLYSPVKTVGAGSEAAVFSKGCPEHLSLTAPMAQDAVPLGWGRAMSKVCRPGPECLAEDREGRARTGATSQQEDRQMLSRCLIISTVFSDPWKSLHPNVDILREHTLLLRAGAITQCPQAGHPVFPWTVYPRGWHGLPLLCMGHPWGWSWAGESHQELYAALGDEAPLQARSPRDMSLCPSGCFPLCRNRLGCSS